MSADASAGTDPPQILRDIHRAAARGMTRNEFLERMAVELNKRCDSRPPD